MQKLTLLFTLFITASTIPLDWPGNAQSGTNQRRHHSLSGDAQLEQKNGSPYLYEQTTQRACCLHVGQPFGMADVYTLLHFDPNRPSILILKNVPNPMMTVIPGARRRFIRLETFAENTIQDAFTMQGKTYLMQDSLRCQDWKILNDLKEVAGHLCMNASWEDTLKQQKIVAWFALDIPHSGGPERLCGLPGLILEADVNNGAMVITADRIEAKKLSTEFASPKKNKGKKVSEAEYSLALKKLIDDHIKEEQPYFWDIRY
jgi:hypothetical protein